MRHFRQADGRLGFARRNRRLAPFFSGRMRGRICRGDSTERTPIPVLQVATGKSRHLFADGRTDLSRRFNGADSRVWFCRNTTVDLRHFRRTRGDLTRRLDGADGQRPVLQKRDRRRAPSFSGQTDLSQRFNSVDSRVWFYRTATGDLRHFSAGERKDLSRRFNGADWLPPVLQKRDRRLAASFCGRTDLSRRLNGADWPRPVLQERDRRLAASFSRREGGFTA